MRTKVETNMGSKVTTEGIQAPPMNPFPIGTTQYKEFEKDSRKGYIVNGAGNYVVYKTSGAQRAIIILLLMILMVILAK